MGDAAVVAVIPLGMGIAVGFFSVGGRGAVGVGFAVGLLFACGGGSTP